MAECSVNHPVGIWSKSLKDQTTTFFYSFSLPGKTHFSRVDINSRAITLLLEYKKRLKFFLNILKHFLVRTDAISKVFWTFRLKTGGKLFNLAMSHASVRIHGSTLVNELIHNSAFKQISLPSKATNKLFSSWSVLL